MEYPFPDLPTLAFPEAALRLEVRQEKWQVYDVGRKKWLVLTPEEWVRQHAVDYLVRHLGYPRALVKSEGGQKVHGMTRRFDVLAYSRAGAPLLLMECKAPSVKITQATFEQVSSYNLHQRAPLLVVTNGLQHYCCQVDFEKRSYSWLQEIPQFDSAGSLQA